MDTWSIIALLGGFALIFWVFEGCPFPEIRIVHVHREEKNDESKKLKDDGKKLKDDGMWRIEKTKNDD